MIDKLICTAVIYSISEIGKYLVEIHHHDKKYFITSKAKPMAFADIQTAKSKAIHEGAVVGFLALDKTYEEVDFVNDYDGKAVNSHHELMPISLK